LTHDDCCGNPPSPGFPVFELDTLDIFFEEFTLKSHVASFFATYGITDRWDVNLLLPVIFTSLDLRVRARINDVSGTAINFFDRVTGTTEQVRSTSDDKIGIGDLLLRSKYYLLGANGFNLAVGSSLRVPTGEEDNFQGLGDVTFTPFFALSQEYGRFDVHASGGIEINFDDSDRSRVRYAGGVTFQVIEQLALLADVIGSSNLTTDRVSVTVLPFIAPPPLPPTRITRVSSTLSTDIVDLALGFKANFYRSVVGFATVFVPLTDDGLRADVIPAAGLEVSF
jgi:hypothetical protein